MPPHNEDDDSDDTDWDSIYDEGHAESSSEQPPMDAPPSAKAMEAANQRQTEAHTQESPSRPHQQSPQSTTRWVNEETPLLDAGPPPPAYSDVTANRPYSGHVALPYGSGSSAPQSMSGVANIEGGDVEQQPSSDEPRKRWRKGRKLSRPRVLIKLVMIALTMILITTLTNTTWHDDTHGKEKRKGDKDTLSPVIPHNETWWWHSPPALSKCRFEYYSLNHYYEFNSVESFSFLELMSEHSSVIRDQEVHGLIKITAPAGQQESAVAVGISISTTEEYEILHLNVKESQDSLFLQAPTLRATGAGSAKPCMAIFVTISIRPDVDITDLEIATEHLSVRVDPSLFDNDKALHISNATEITAVHGDVSIAYLSSRSTIINVISGSISGTYALRDLLSIKTHSGTIDVDVKPKSVDKTAPAPADFTAITTSGSITVSFPISGTADEIPEREYRTRTETSSGSVKGSYILGSVSTFKTTSGSISADVLPYSANMFASSLRTETSTGRTELNLFSPFRKDERSITRLQSYHRSISSSLALNYPQEWEGDISGSVISGSLAVEGKDVKVLNLREGPVGKKILARKGHGDSRLDFKAASGSVHLTVGDTH